MMADRFRAAMNYKSEVQQQNPSAYFDHLNEMQASLEVSDFAAQELLSGLPTRELGLREDFI
jgi:hypothetical protein